MLYFKPLWARLLIQRYTKNDNIERICTNYQIMHFQLSKWTLKLSNHALSNRQIMPTNKNYLTRITNKKPDRCQGTDTGYGFIIKPQESMDIRIPTIEPIKARSGWMSLPFLYVTNSVITGMSNEIPRATQARLILMRQHTQKAITVPIDLI